MSPSSYMRIHGFLELVWGKIWGKEKRGKLEEKIKVKKNKKIKK